MSELHKENTPSVDAPFVSNAQRLSPVFLLGSIVLFGLYLYAQMEAIDRNGSHANRMLLALLAIVLFVAYAFARRGSTKTTLFKLWGKNATTVFSGRWWLMIVISLTCVWGAFNYYQYDRQLFRGFDSNQDAAYYYLNSKYFDELGYYELYPAMLLADQQTDNKLETVTSYRDLHDYKMVRRSRISQVEEQVVGAFEPGRWSNFKHDVDHIVSSWGKREKRYFFSDHGFNPPPTWTVVGGTMSDVTAVEDLKRITMVDFYLVAAMFVLIGVTFGFDTLLFCLLLFLCTYSGRWPVLGQSLLRFDWVVALVCSVCMLKRGNWATAGAFMAYSSLNRIFPAIFFFPVGVLLIRDLVRNRELCRLGSLLKSTYARFIVGAALMSALLIGGATAKYGVDSFVQSKENLIMHNSADSYSRYRTGWGDALIYRGERTRVEFIRAGAIAAKQELLNDLKPLTNACGLLTLLFIGVVAWRKKYPAHELIHLCIIPFFCLTTPQINYFNLRLLLIIWHMHDPRRARNIFGIIALLGIEAVVQHSHVFPNDRYATTSLNSIGLSFYFIVMLLALSGSLIADLRPRGLASKARLIAKKWPAVAAATGLVGLAMVFNYYWNLGMDTGRAEHVPSGRLAQVHEDGTRWDARGTKRIRKGRSLIVDFGKDLRNEPRLDISFDRNDIYHLRFYRDAKHVGELDVTRDGDGGRGLFRKVIEIPSTAAQQGYNGILVTPRRGPGDNADTRFSLGHIRPVSAETPTGHRPSEN